MEFSEISEKQVAKAIISEFSREFEDYIETDVIVVGAGPSGLIASKELAEKGVKTLLVESNNYLGGGFWIGGYLINKITLRAPAQRILNEIGVPYEEAEEGLYVANGPHACSKLIAAACDAGIKVLNTTKVDDVKAGSWLHMKSEGGSHWRWYFDGETVVEESGRVVSEHSD